MTDAVAEADGGGRRRAEAAEVSWRLGEGTGWRRVRRQGEGAPIWSG